MAKSADAFRTISEVAEWLETPAHVLRFWESKFSHVKPVKRAGGRRYYRPADMLLLGGIKKLLHDDGMTIKGVQKILREHGIKHVSAFSAPLDEISSANTLDMAIDATPQQPQAATVLSFQRDTAPVEATPEITSAEDDPAPAPTPLDLDSEVSQTVSDRSPESEPETAPARDPEPQERETAASAQQPEPAPADTEAESEAQSPQAAPTEEPTKPEPPRPVPVNIDLPDDPADSIEAPAGVLTALAAMKRPISKEHAKRLSMLTNRLRGVGNGNDAQQTD